MTGRNDPCWCGSGRKWKQCHFPHEKKQKPHNDHSITADYYRKHRILIKTPEQIAGIRDACHLAAQILDETCRYAQEGITTQQINDFAHRLHLEANAKPAPLGYGTPPFPKSICTSLNEVICHGIPDDVPLKKGDIVNIDITCIYKGYYGDCSKMVTIGKTTEERQRVVRVSYECLKRSVAILKPGLLVSAIGETIENYALSQNCSVVNQFVGHGVGVEFHEGPQIPHYRNAFDLPLVPGMTFTIEPMINAGVREAIVDRSDKWTARTADQKASAQWEHTVLITESGHEILTPWTK